MPVLYLTGASGALGTSIRQYFLDAGWHVAGFDRALETGLATGYHSYTMNAMDEASVEASFAQATNELGAPRTLIATVGGVAGWKSVKETELADFRKLLDLNLTSFFLSAKHALRLMKGTGSIISIGAEQALSPSAKKGGYAASKSGVVTLTRIIAEEGKLEGVNANCIVPTTIHTMANEEWGEPADFAKWTEPKDIAAMCMFLSSDAGQAVNGSVIRMPNKM